jgi:DNA-binding NarL/FixJ family response regulator
MRKSIRVLIADDHELFRCGIRFMLESTSKHITVVGEAANGRDLVKQVARLYPDVVVTDIRMPVMSGYEASMQIVQNHPNTKVIALTMFEDANLIYEMFEAGAKGYLIKSTGASEMLEAIETVHSGSVHYCSSSTSSLVKVIGNSKFNQFKKERELKLSESEQKVMKMICRQLTTKEMASELCVSDRTIEEYSKRLKQKTGAKNLVGIAMFAIKNQVVRMHEL